MTDQETKTFYRLVMWAGIALVVLAAAVGVVSKAQGQEVPAFGRVLPPTVTEAGFVIGQARTLMESQWTEDSTQLEHGYCVVNPKFTRAQAEFGEPGYDEYIVVDSVVPAVIQAAGVAADGHMYVAFICGPNQQTVHTHPPLTCWSGYKGRKGCQYGGPSAFQCFPSRSDLDVIEQRGMEWSIIQCDKHSFVYYFVWQKRVLVQPKPLQRDTSVK